MRVVIAGNGVAGVTVARLLRDRDADSSIHIFAREKVHYYPRPRLTEVMAAEQLDTAQLTFYSPEWYEERRIGVSLGVSIEGIDRERCSVTLSGGATSEYDVLVLAVGARSNLPAISGLGKPGVFALRTVDDLLEIRQYSRGARQGVVIGGGLLGLEAAKGLRSLGLEVSVIEFFPRLLPRQLDDESAELFRTLVQSMGIEVYLSAATDSIIGESRVEGVALKDSRNIPCDLVLISAGITPNKELAEMAGLATGKGVTVDSAMRSSDPRIYAVGDCAERDGRVYGIIPAAVEQARVAADNILGGSTVYKGTILSNTLKAVGIDLTSIGLATPDADGFEEFSMRDDERGVYRKVTVKDGKVVGAIVVGETRSVPYLSQMIARGVDVAGVKESLVEEGFDLKGFLR